MIYLLSMFGILAAWSVFKPRSLLVGVLMTICCIGLLVYSENEYIRMIASTVIVFEAINFVSLLLSFRRA